MTEPIIDAHHHIWRLDKLPWLNGPTVPRIFGDYQAIKRDYDISEFAQDAKPSGVTKSVYVQANVAPGDQVWEAGWAGDEGRRENLVQGVVSAADLAAENLPDLLDRQAEIAPLRGVRQQLHWHENALYRFAERPDLMLDKAWRRGLAEVARRGLLFELQVFENQYPNALELIDGHPDATFVLLHAGMPEDISPPGTKAWAAGLARFAERDNVYTKISGLGTFSHRCALAEWGPLIERTVDTFGPDRCLFGSNFPVEKLWTDYATLVDVVRNALEGYTPAERRSVLHDTAAHLYRL